MSGALGKSPDSRSVVGLVPRLCVIYREARDLINLCFSSVQFVHVPRSCNRCAHELARLSLGWDPDQPFLWLDPLPSFVIDLVVRDYAEPDVNE